MKKRYFVIPVHVDFRINGESISGKLEITHQGRHIPERKKIEKYIMKIIKGVNNQEVDDMTFVVLNLIEMSYQDFTNYNRK